MKDNKTRIDTIRLIVLTCAELFDAWRVVPRLLVMAYGYLCWEIVKWYTNLRTTIIPDCDVELLGELCITNAPTTQHSALVTVMVGASAAVFAFYTNTGRSWAKAGFIRWDDTTMQESDNEFSNKPRYNSDPMRGRDRGNRRKDRFNEDDGFWDEDDQGLS